MNTLKKDRHIAVISALVEGNSIRSVERLTGVHRDTINRLLVRVGKHCDALSHLHLRGLKCQRLQLDEIWTYVGKKEDHITPEDQEAGPGALGAQYVFVGLDADTKLAPAYLVGRRNASSTRTFLRRLTSRIRGGNDIQVSTDGFGPYTDAVPAFFGPHVHFAQVVKSFATEGIGPGRYAPPAVAGMVSTVINGNPDPIHVSTSYVERHNLQMRMCIRRLTRLTNAFSRKLENLEAAIALYFAHYNFVKIHGALGMTPAMAAGVARGPWGMAMLVA